MDPNFDTFFSGNILLEIKFQAKCQKVNDCLCFPLPWKNLCRCNQMSWYYLKNFVYLQKGVKVRDSWTKAFILVLVNLSACLRCSRNFPLLELCSVCLREGLGRSKPATNPWNKHNNTTMGTSSLSKPYWTVFYRIKWALQAWES